MPPGQPRRRQTHGVVDAAHVASRGQPGEARRRVLRPARTQPLADDARRSTRSWPTSREGGRRPPRAARCRAADRSACATRSTTASRLDRPRSTRERPEVVADARRRPCRGSRPGCAAASTRVGSAPRAPAASDGPAQRDPVVRRARPRPPAAASPSQTSSGRSVDQPRQHRAEQGLADPPRRPAARVRTTSISSASAAIPTGSGAANATGGFGGAPGRRAPAAARRPSSAASQRLVQLATGEPRRVRTAREREPPALARLGVAAGAGSGRASTSGSLPHDGRPRPSRIDPRRGR